MHGPYRPIKSAKQKKREKAAPEGGEKDRDPEETRTKSGGGPDTRGRGRGNAAKPGRRGSQKTGHQAGHREENRREIEAREPAGAGKTGGQEERMKIMQRTYICANGIVEKTRFLVGDRTKPRGKKQAASSFRKQEDNTRQAVRKLARALNCNFYKGDLLVTLRYDDDGLHELPEWMTDPDGCRKAAEKRIQNFLRRLRRKHPGLKYVYVTSDMDGETGEAKRIHHHLVISGEGLSWDEIMREWHCGSVDIRPIRGQDDLTPVAVYMLRQVRRVPDAKKYTASRNLAKPVVEETEIIQEGPIRVQAGSKLLERQYVDGSPVQYVRFVKKQRAGGEPAGKGAGVWAKATTAGRSRQSRRSTPTRSGSGG